MPGDDTPMEFELSEDLLEVVKRAKQRVA